MRDVGGRRRCAGRRMVGPAILAGAGLAAAMAMGATGGQPRPAAHAAVGVADHASDNDATPIPTTTPDADGWIALRAGAVDYAPNGLPDFDQRQPQWRSRDPIRKVWTHDGPAAVADALWWLDAQHETGPPPPAVVDQFGLVRALGGWDDHAVDNVRPFGQSLAGVFRTNGVFGNYFGTCLDELDAGLQSYLREARTEPLFDTRLVEKPTLAHVAEAIARGEPVVALVGLWQNTHLSGWSRIGGHYVAVEAVNPATGKLRVADPYLDVARPSAGESEHGDAALVSHDTWTLSPALRPGPVLRLDGYLEATGDVAAFMANFYGQNRRTCDDSDVAWADGEPVEAHLDTILAIQVAPPPTETPTPTRTPSATPTDTPRPSPTASPTGTRERPTDAPEPTAATPTPIAGETPDPRETPTPVVRTATASATIAPRASRTPTPPPLPTPSADPSEPPGAVPSMTPTAPTRTPTARPTAVIPTLTARPSRTPTPTDTLAPPPTDPPTATPKPTRTPGPGDVCGAVVEQRTRRPLGHVKVWLYRSEEPLGVTRTVDNGTFCFLALPHGPYDVRAERSGCTTLQQPVDIAGGMRYLDLEMTCRRFQTHLPLAIKRRRLR